MKPGTSREQAVIAIWDKVEKPSRQFSTPEEQAAYLLGIADEKRAQTQYDEMLRAAGLR